MRSTKQLTHIFFRLSRIISSENAESGFVFHRTPSFFEQAMRDDIFTLAVPRLILTFASTARASEDIRIMVFAADVMGLMRPLLEVELRGHPTIHLNPHHNEHCYCIRPTRLCYPRTD